METGRLKLHPCQMDDLQIIHQLWMNDHVRHFLFDDRIISLDEARKFVERSLTSFRENGYGLWLVYLRGNDQLIGFAGLLGLGEAEPDLIYGIHPDHIGKGYGTEAAKVVLNYGLRELRIPKVRAGVDEPNTISARVLEKLGMKQVGGKTVEGHPVLYYEITKPNDMA
jgi:[ribosomal protein S5]-alanine N-acetyltransferase